MKETQNHVLAMVDSLISGAEMGEDLRFYEGLKKWKPLLINMINKVCYITNQNPDDVLQDILLGISKVNSIYDVPLFRYNKRLYEKHSETENQFLLVTPRTQCGKTIKLWVDKNDTEVVRKGKYESTIYRELQQRCFDIISSHFVQRNGYKKIITDEELVRIASDSDKITYKKKNITKIERITETIGIGEINERDRECFGINDDIENELIFKQYMKNIQYSISSDARVIFNWMICNPGYSDKKISKLMEIPIKKVKLAICEIERNIPFLKNEESEISEYTNPIYVKLSEI